MGPTAALRLGAGGAGGGVLGRRRRCAWAAFAVRGGARRHLCEVRQHRGRRLRGVCVARAACVFHVKHDVYRVAGWMLGSGGIGKRAEMWVGFGLRRRPDRSEMARNELARG